MVGASRILCQSLSDDHRHARRRIFHTGDWENYNQPIIGDGFSILRRLKPLAKEIFLSEVVIQLTRFEKRLLESEVIVIAAYCKPSKTEKNRLGGVL